jgi:hypothetical protein
VDTARITHPALGTNTREERALDLYRERGHEIITLGEGTFEVPSCTGRNVYEVRYGGTIESCSCPDFGFGHTCKHLLAVGITHAARRSGVREVRILRAAGGDPFAHAGKRSSRGSRRSCPSCFGGYVTLTVEEDGQERDEAVPCRRCSDDGEL